MSFDLKSITSNAAQHAPRIILLGVEKAGKSTWASEAESPIFIPVKGETGLDYITTPRFPACETFEQVMDALRVLYNESHDYKTIVIDSASALEPLIWDHACKMSGVESVEKIGGGFGKWKNETLRYWRELTGALDYLRNDKDTSDIIIGHVKAKDFNDPEASEAYTTYMFDIADNAAALLFRWSDAILFANFKKAIIKKTEGEGFRKSTIRAVGTGDRVLYTQKRPAHPGGGRGVCGHLPYEIPMGYGNFIAAVEAANGKEAANTKPESTEKKSKK